MISRLKTAWMTSRIALGLLAFLAGVDKFLNVLTNWEQYVSPFAARMLPFSATTFMHIVGVIEIRCRLSHPYQSYSLGRICGDGLAALHCH